MQLQTRCKIKPFVTLGTFVLFFSSMFCEMCLHVCLITEWFVTLYTLEVLSRVNCHVFLQTWCITEGLVALRANMWLLFAVVWHMPSKLLLWRKYLQAKFTGNFLFHFWIRSSDCSPHFFPQMTTTGFVSFAFTFSHLMSTFMNFALSWIILWMGEKIDNANKSTTNM